MLEMVLENAVDEFEWAAVLIYYNTNIDDGQAHCSTTSTLDALQYTSVKKII